MVNPFVYDENNYKGTFLTNHPYNTLCELKDIKQVIYVFWTGNNPMTENRLQSLKNLKTRSGIEIQLITPENVQNFILPDYPLHPAYEYLSLVHRSDYLRCYFMHHFGGGYSDLKSCQHSWSPIFDKLQKSSAWLIGYPELRKTDLGARDLPQVRKNMVSYLSQITGNGAYICRAYTPFTTEWYAELHQRLDAKYEIVKQNPGNVWGDNTGYPFQWSELNGDITHPLILKYMQFTLKDERLRPILTNYR